MATQRVTIPFPKHPKYGDDEVSAVTALIRSGSLSEIGRGPAVTAIEDAFAALTGTTHALSFNSGTASLHGALHAVGVTPDQGVAMSPMTWISAINAAFHAGSFPLFSDISADSPNLDPAGINPSNCSAVLATHAWGVPASMERFADLPVPVVEDCSHAHGAVYRGRSIGSWGVAGCFSLQESKAVSGGEGGVLTTSDPGIYQRAMTLGHHPFRLEEELTDPELVPLTEAAASYKFRMPALAAVIARVQLRSLPDRMRNSETNLAHLTQLITEADLPLAPVPVSDDTVRGWYGTPFTVQIRVSDPASFFAACKAAGLPVRALYADWLTSPLMTEPRLIERYWPHMRGRWMPPGKHDFPNYQRFRRQTILLKVPDVPSPDYMEQVAATLAATLQSLLSSGMKGT
ncbi:dTDP-4-amino-4,6-dideoxygalactose transaminase [Sinosporangium album]|uniref:dTDP-4-amino-4,6-dideoxygalactose transaminase n=1 Tax=Sinosporangium album TaxID=504805 RepID=A0A1G8KY88_9ACTN|nr:DegT/DnrJ/EryC1/StrS family aminotransferase [Sinosporangium album]SDI48333.1 dTDP-4-amino-4,6-dideoxygalactose transaminase [Sinosporangium album]